MRARLVLVVLLSLVLIVAGPWSARAESPTAAVAASAAFPFAATAVNFSPLFAPDLAGIVPWISNPLLLGTHVPMYWLDARRAGWYTAGGLALPAAGVSLMLAAPEGSVAGEWAPTLLSSYSNLMLYSAYDISVRTDRSSGAQPTRPEEGTIGRLAAAPFSSAIADPVVWVPSLIGAAAFTGWHIAFERDEAVGVYESGDAYIGSNRVSPVAGGAYHLAKSGVDMLPIAIGEEAFYRGVVYERTLRAHGRSAARLLDAVLFPLVHLPNDVQRGFKPPTVAFNFAWRSAMTLAFDAAYDRGGLPLSVALHYWSNLLLAMSRWWFYGGSL